MSDYNDYSEDSSFQKMMGRSKEWCLIGEQIANDCLVNGLRKGERVNLSEITAFINQNYTYNTGAVENGFLTRMKVFIENDEILNFTGENGETVFIHKNYINEQLS